MKKKKNLTTIILVIMFFGGIALFLYPLAGDMINSYRQKAAVDEYILHSETSYTTADYTEFFAQADEYNARLAAGGLNPGTVESGYNTLLSVEGSDVIGIVSIDKIGVKLPIYHGVSEAVLAAGVGHMPETSLPVGGASTHSVISSHTGLPSATLFTDIINMEIGDTFTITVLNRLLTYEVDQIKTVEPHETDDLQIIDGEDHCTLLTCTPYGINSHRLLVRGVRIPNPVMKEYAPAEAVFRLNSITATGIIVASLLLIILLIILRRRIRRGRAQS